MIRFAYMKVKQTTSKRNKEMTTYSVIKKSAGYSVKNFNNESDARRFAALCCKNNNNSNYGVFVKIEGVMTEI